METEGTSSRDDANDSQHDENSRLLINKTQAFKVYGRRWFIIFIYFLNLFFNSVSTYFLSGINNIAVLYYNVEEVSIETLANMVLIPSVFLFIPQSLLCSRTSVRKMIIYTATLQLLSSIIHCFALKRDRFWVLILSQIFTALVAVTLLIIPTRISTTWFPERERATASAISFSSFCFGPSVGLFLPSILVKEHSDIEQTGNELKFWYNLLLVFGLLVFIVSLFYTEKPPTPPSDVVKNDDEKINYRHEIRLLLRNKNFILHSQVYGLYFSLSGGLPVLINAMVTTKYKHGYDNLIGWMYLCMQLSNIVAFFSIGRLVDRYKCFKLAAISLNLLSMISFITFYLVLAYTESFSTVFAIYIIYGIFSNPYIPIAIEQAVKLTRPVQEQISGAVFMTFSFTYQIIVIYGLGYLIQKGYFHPACYLVACLYLIAGCVAYFVKHDYKGNIPLRT